MNSCGGYEKIQIDIWRDGTDRAITKDKLNYPVRVKTSPTSFTSRTAGAGEALRQYLVSTGQREEQIKIPVLQNAAECGFDFGPFEAGDSE